MVDMFHSHTHGIKKREQKYNKTHPEKRAEALFFVYN